MWCLYSTWWVRYIACTKKKSRVVIIIGAVVVAAGVTALVATGHSTPPRAPMVSHTIHPTKADDAALESTFLAYKIHNKEMTGSDRVMWGQVLQNGSRQPLLAYDAVDKRTWALAAFNLVLPASYRAEVSFQDGGNVGIFFKIGSGKWTMTGSPGFPLCAKDVQWTVAQLWGLKNYPACN